MERSTNALAELAKRLKPKGNDCLYFLIDYGDMLKAARIVAELAKVEYGDDGHIRYWTDTEIKLKKCRAIARKEARNEDD